MGPNQPIALATAQISFCCAPTARQTSVILSPAVTDSLAS